MRAHDLNQLEAFVDHPGDMVDAEDVGRAGHQAAFPL